MAAAGRHTSTQSAITVEEEREAAPAAEAGASPTQKKSGGNPSLGAPAIMDPSEMMEDLERKLADGMGPAKFAIEFARVQEQLGIAPVTTDRCDGIHGARAPQLPAYFLLQAHMHARTPRARPAAG